MNKSITVIIFMCTVVVGYAQVTFGVKGGLNLNTIANVGEINVNDPNQPTSIDYKTSLGYNLGAYLSLPVSKRSTIYFELQYSLRGGKIEDVKHNLNYVELPIVFSYSIVKKLAIEVGPSFSYKISAIASDDGTKNNIDLLFDENIDIGIYSGVRVPLNDRIAIIGRYYVGLLKLFQITYTYGPMPTDGTDEIKCYSRTIQLGLTYKIK